MQLRREYVTSRKRSRIARRTTSIDRGCDRD